MVIWAGDGGVVKRARGISAQGSKGDKTHKEEVVVVCAVVGAVVHGRCGG